MKTVSEKQGLARLDAVRERFRETTAPFEAKAKACATCETKGACCLDAHFVNVHITRLEAVSMRGVLETLPDELRTGVLARVNTVVEEYGLGAEGDGFGRTYPCPLFDARSGCLVHRVKPLACIEHACYADRDDLPPADLRESAESEVDAINRAVYRRPAVWLPIPVALLTRTTADSGDTQ